MSKWLGLAVLAVVGLGTGCHQLGAQEFACSAEKTCGPGGTCEPNGFCSFDDSTCPAPGRRYGDLSGGSSGKCVGQEEIDAGTDTSSSGPDAQACFGTSPVTICLQSAPTAPLSISTPSTIDTNSSMCATLKSGGNYCVIAATTISIDAALQATGPRPLILLASDSITIGANGVVDVGSHRGVPPALEIIGAGAEPVTCTDGTLPGSAGTTNGGGAGGSFIGSGGTGGAGGKGGAGGIPGAPVTNITGLRGGCAGQDGKGPGASKGVHGHGGGAVLLIAGHSVDMRGTINAAGEGGGGGANSDSGGGGGGAGGMIAFDAPTVVASGLILANGGGGGGGSGGSTAGTNGSDPNAITAAAGGTAGSVGGNGGNGSAGPAAGAGVNGASGSGTGSGGGGGGGGGGAGLVKVPANANLGANVSPAATQ